MPKKAKPLTAKEVSNLRRPGLHAVGGVDGLYLRVYESGARCWVLRYATPEVRQSESGKSFRARRDLGLGGYPDVTLRQARDKARQYRDQIRDGIDPAKQRADARLAWAESLRRGITFEEAARKCYAAKAAEFKGTSHRKTWIGRLERYAFPKIGQIPVAEVDVNHVLSVVEPIWQTKTETANRVRMRIETVLKWAKVAGYRDGDNPAEWRGNLKELLPDPAKISKVQHYASLPWQRAPSFLAELRQQQGMGARALEFIIYTAARSGEVRGATWDEIDLQRRLWTISGERMKGGKPHHVPLNDAAVELLSGLPTFAGSNYVFTAPRGGPVSDMTISAVLRRTHKASVDAGGEGWTEPSSGRVAVPHGMRSSFKDWARNRTAYPDEVSELQLAHVNDDKTRAAYARDELLPQRFRLMDEWGRFLREGLPEGDVSSIREGAK